MQIVKEPEFREQLVLRLLNSPAMGLANSVSGPGRRGARAAVYPSHFLGVPFIPYGTPIPEKLRPHLVIDTATDSGATLRKARRKTKAEFVIAVYKEPPRLKFWYERY